MNSNTNLPPPSQSQGPEVQTTACGSNVCESEAPIHVPRKRLATSDVWNYFTAMGLGPDNKPKAKCNGCEKEFSAGGSTHGTSTLSRHLQRCPKFKEHHDVGQMLVDHAGKLRSRKLDQKILRDFMSKCIITHNLPFSFAEYEGLWKMLKYCNPDAKNISRNTATSDIWKLYTTKKASLKKELEKIPSRICLTSDIWTACTTERYISLTAHYVDSNFTLCNKILAFSNFPPPHTGREMAQKLIGILKEWGIEKKIFSITLDNAKNNDSMVGMLRDHLYIQNHLLCSGDFFHVRCAAHILNLIVQEGLKEVDDALDKIRESVRYVKSSEGRMKRFQECVKDVQIEGGVFLRLDLPTRWNSTFMMIESAMKYKRAFASYHTVEEHFMCCPSIQEWERAKRMMEFLRPFYDITNLISGSTYPTSNIYFYQVWTIECLLINSSNSEDACIQDMAIRMKVKFDKYWSEYSVVLALGAVLDPRMKFALLEQCYNVIDPDGCQLKLEVVKKKLFQLYDAYASNSTTASSSSSSNPTNIPKPSGSRQSGKKTISFQSLKELDNQIVARAGKSQLELYLEEPKFDVSYYEDLDVLHYWKQNRKRFPDLALMAVDILSIPITTVASESAFSIGSRVLNKYRSSTLPAKVEALLCTRTWLYGFDPEDEEESIVGGGPGGDDDDVVDDDDDDDESPSNAIVDIDDD